MLRFPFSTLFLAAVVTITPAFSAPVYDTAATLTGTRSEGTASIVVGGNYAGGAIFSLAWNITDNLNGTWLYEYTLTNMNAQAAGMSHFILDFTDNCLEAANQSVCIRDIEASGEYDLEWGTYSSANPSNPGMGGTIVGLKFDDTDFDSPGTISFTSSRAPVWGDFYIKGGSSSFIYNAGLANHASENILDFIARPNGTGTPTQQNDVPEPATLGIVGAGLAALAVMRRRRA